MQSDFRKFGLFYLFNVLEGAKPSNFFKTKENILGLSLGTGSGIVNNVFEDVGNTVWDEAALLTLGTASIHYLMSLGDERLKSAPSSLARCALHLGMGSQFTVPIVLSYGTTSVGFNIYEALF